MKGLTIALLVLVAVLAAAVGVEAYFLVELRNDLKGSSDAPVPASVRPVRTRSAAAPLVSARRNPDPFFYRSGSAAGNWDPFEEMDQIQDEMNRLFRDSLQRGMPSGASFSYNPEVDFRETDKAYVVKLDLPGIDKDKISVKVENGLLEISGERENGTEEKTKDGGLYRSERSFGSFLRTVPIPADADTQGLTAEEKQGVLTVTIPKLAAPPPPHKVAVK